MVTRTIQIHRKEEEEEDLEVGAVVVVVAELGVVEMEEHQANTAMIEDAVERIGMMVTLIRRF